MGFIKSQKDRIQRVRMQNKLQRIEQETENYRINKLRQEKLATANKVLEQERNEYKRFESYNKSQEQPNKLLAFGQNLQKIMNKEKPKEKGRMRLVQTVEGSTGLNTEVRKDIFGGGTGGFNYGLAKNIETGGQSKSIFDLNRR